jgi:hypothetical protein
VRTYFSATPQNREFRLAHRVIVVSQKLDDDQLYQKAKAFLLGHNVGFSLNQARRIGVDANYEIMEACQVDRKLLKCSDCRGVSVPCQKYAQCRTYH